jgi:hypothetical protein
VSAIRFKARLVKPEATAKIGTGMLITLPAEASRKLPSRGMTMVEGTINSARFRSILEPDGQGSHWFRVDMTLRKAAGADEGDSVTLEIEPTKQWPEPTVPANVKTALAADPQARTQWLDITAMARWDWLNWMEAVKLPGTRQERPDKLCSMLKAGKRRPCCFNRTLQMPPKRAELLYNGPN